MDTKRVIIKGTFTFVEMGAIMVRFNTSMRLVCVDMEGVEMGADRFDRSEILRGKD